jgi:helix-turn-helix protein
MVEIPVKIERQGTWYGSKITVDKEQITIPQPFNLQIPYKQIIDLTERKNILTLTLKGPPEKTLSLATIPKALMVLKKMIIISCSAYRLAAYFMSPAIRGGVLTTNARWEKGSIAVLKTGIWFVSEEKQVCVTLSDVAGIELTKRDVQQKQVDVVKIDHLEGSEVVTSFVLCPLSTLQVLFNFLKDATKEMDMRGDELDPVSAQVGMLIYSGMDSHAIETMLSVSNKELESIYDKLLKLGLIEVQYIRREVQLTPKGVRFITEAVKPPAE